MDFSERKEGLCTELYNKTKNMDIITDIKELDKSIVKIINNSTTNISECLENLFVDINNIDDNIIYKKNLEPNTKYEINEDTYETDDKGRIYKKNNEVLPNIEYKIGDTSYRTDDKGRTVYWEGSPKYNADNERNESAQTDAGGKDRQKGDDGGHLVARVLGGASGKENIVAMRDTINRGDYKRSENEIAEAVKQGKEVKDSGKIIYEGDSQRPSKIERTYEIDGKKTELTVDNDVESKDLIEDIDGLITEDDMNNLKDEISDMEQDGCKVSITSIEKKYDESGNLISVTVGIRNETDGDKTYKVYQP